jgi:ArsR family transcriptional regulator
MISKGVFEMQAQLCQAMGHAARLEIVHILQNGPQHVSGLVQAMGLSQATLSRHLAVLRHHGMVEVQRQGQENVYQLANPKIVTVCNLIREVLAEQITRQSEIAKTISG